MIMVMLSLQLFKKIGFIFRKGLFSIILFGYGCLILNNLKRILIKILVHRIAYVLSTPLCLQNIHLQFG